MPQKIDILTSLPVRLHMWTLPNFVRYSPPSNNEDGVSRSERERTIAVQDMDPHTLSHFLDQYREAVFSKAGLEDPNPPKNSRD